MIGDYHSLMATLEREFPLLAMSLVEHRSLRGGAMSYGTMPYIPPLLARFPHVEGADIISGVQTGKSELFIQQMLYQTGWEGRVCAYVLPTFSVRSRFVKRRIDPLLAEVPAYRDRLPGGAPGLAPTTGSSKGSQALKLFGAGTMMFLGSNTATDFIEFSADTLFIDEVDQCDPGNLAKARDRIRASPKPQLFRLGNPTIPGVGVDRLYQRTDQRRWYYRCPRCNEGQPLDWFVNFVERLDNGAWIPRDRARVGVVRLQQDGFLQPVVGDLRPCCRKCHKPFERAEAWLAWVCENPHLGAREGYRMTRLDVLHQSIRELFAEWLIAQRSPNDLATFYTSNLGLAYEQSGQSVTIEDIRACATGAPLDPVGDPSYRRELICMGVDVGNLLNVSIDRIDWRAPEEGEDAASGLRRTNLWTGAVVRFEELDDLIRRYHVDQCVVDAMPETRKAQELRDRWRGNECEVWLCRFFNVPKVGERRFGMRMDWKTREVQVDRTQLLDAAFDDIRLRRRVFPDDIETVLGFSDQMRAPKRVLDEARSRIIWSEGNAPDHYRFADAYALVAYELSQQGGTYSSVG